jgi:hypothetical protein
MILLLTASHSDGRPSRVWTYKLLLSESALVCIGWVKSTKVVENKDFSPDSLEGLESEISVLAALKGDPQTDRIRFRHFRYRQDIKTTLGNGPSFAVLRDLRDIEKTKGRGGPVTVGENKKMNTTFIFFLTQRKDGTYGPTSGDDDASISVAQVIGYTDDDLDQLQK